ACAVLVARTTRCTCAVGATTTSTVSSSNQVTSPDYPSWHGEQALRRLSKRLLGELTRPNTRVNGASRKPESVVLTSSPDPMGTSCASSGKLNITTPTDRSSLI